MDNQRIADELAIRDLVNRYSDAVVRRDAKAWGDTWADDGEWQILGNSIRGRDEIVERWLKFMSGLPFVVQQASGGIIDFEERDAAGAATGRWYVNEYGFTGKGAGMLTLGVYHDGYTRTNDRWRFSRRRFDVLYMGPPDLSAPHHAFPDIP